MKKGYEIKKLLGMFILAALVAVLSACGGNGGTGQKPSITSFTATPSTVDAGQASTLAWTVTGDAPITLTINQGVGTVTGQTSKEVSPTATTTYTLTAENSSGEDTETVTVTVNGSQACADPVAIPDANLEQAIRETLGTASGDLTCADMASLTELEATGRDISSLEGLQHAVNLTFLDVRDNALTGIAPIEGLEGLERLYLNRNPISSRPSLDSFPNLTELGLESIGIDDTDLPMIAELTKLQFLGLEDNDVSDISDLSGLTNLEQLELQDNEVADISALANLTNLSVLFLQRNQITDISALVANSGLGAGDEVDVSNNLLDLDDPDVQADIQALVNRGVDLTYATQKNGNVTLVPGMYNLAVIDDPHNLQGVVRRRHAPHRRSHSDRERPGHLERR